MDEKRVNAYWNNVGDHVVYFRKTTSAEIKTLPDETQNGLDGSEDLYTVFRHDGVSLAIVEGFQKTKDAIASHNLIAHSVH